MIKSILFIGILLIQLGIARAETLFLGTDYVLQQGTRSSGTTVTYFDNNDYMVYTSVNFGPSGTTKGFLINYNKGNQGGKLEIRLGSSTSGELIAEMTPARVDGGWGAEPSTAYVGLLKDVDGVHDITLVGKDNSGVMNLFSFELSEFSERDATLTRIDASEYSTQLGTTVGSNFGIGYYDNNDFLTYSNINFGTDGTTTGIRIRYAKNNIGGQVEIRLGGPDGALLATFKPSYTGGWLMFMDGYVGIDGVSGVHDLTFVGKDASGVMNMLWFELSDDRNELFAKVPATEFATHQGVRSNTQAITHFSSDDYLTYSNINFGSSGTTKSIRLSYSKGNDGGELEMRLGGPEGNLIGTYTPENTGGWDDFIDTYYVPIDLVDGVHDLTFVAKNSGGLFDLEWFELSETLIFRLATDYKVDDANGIDVQCTYEVVKEHYIEQVYTRYYSSSGSSVDDKFFADLGVSGIDAAKKAVFDLCSSAQAGTDEM